jgi:hypothetical protein
VAALSDLDQLIGRHRGRRRVKRCQQLSSFAKRGLHGLHPGDALLTDRNVRAEALFLAAAQLPVEQPLQFAVM